MDVHFNMMLLCIGVKSMFVFFFSSRRRHTRFDCDWSSDVCSSDLSVQMGSQRLGVIAKMDLVEINNQPQVHVPEPDAGDAATDRKRTRLNSSHSQISYAVFCLKRNRR